ncbi:RluA family pseudouridine synthase [Mariniluteicoccus endophyticus]
MRDFLVDRIRPVPPTEIDRMLAAGEFVDAQGIPWEPDAAYRPHTFVWFHRVLREEPPVPFDVPVLYRDERIVVVDKPHFMATIPRGRHITETVVVRLRAALDLPNLVPAHRLDRLTAGVLLLTTGPAWRSAYQGLFENRLVNKEYSALAGFRDDLELPHVRRSHIVKKRGELRAYEVEELPPNSETLIELVERRGDHAHYRLAPHTGKTHQLRLHLSALGIGIVGDPLYPDVLPDDVDDFSTPLELIARRLEFVDPVDGTPRAYVSAREHAPA